MTPPEAPDTQTGTTPPAVSACPKGGVVLVTLRNRSDFLAAARARKFGTSTMLVQARDRRDGTNDIRVGFTCSKKVGNAVARNRAKRRLREVARAILPKAGQPGWDYVLIGKPKATGSAPYPDLLTDFARALAKLHAPR